MQAAGTAPFTCGSQKEPLHPVAPENRDVIKPEPKRPVTLERRSPQ
jgi:hypothetical protein